MNRTPANGKPRKQRFNRQANKLKFCPRVFAMWTAFVTSMTIGFLNMPLECSKINIELDYPRVKIEFQLQLNLEEVKYCEATPEQNNRVE